MVSVASPTLSSTCGTAAHSIIVAALGRCLQVLRDAHSETRERRHGGDGRDEANDSLQRRPARRGIDGLPAQRERDAQRHRLDCRRDIAHEKVAQREVRNRASLMPLSQQDACLRSDAGDSMTTSPLDTAE